jgi:hypothetical protein
LTAAREFGRFEFVILLKAPAHQAGAFSKAAEAHWRFATARSPQSGHNVAQERRQPLDVVAAMRSFARGL